MDWLVNRTIDYCAYGNHDSVSHCSISHDAQDSEADTGDQALLPHGHIAPPQRSLHTFCGHRKDTDAERTADGCKHMQHTEEIGKAFRREGYECLQYETVATTFRGSTGEDDYVGAHVTPQLCKNRPRIPRELWNHTLVHRGGVLLPFQLDHHFGPVFSAARAEDEAVERGEDPGFHSREDIAFWRGQDTFGPKKLAAIQTSCGGHDQVHIGARGAPGDFYRTGLPHECGLLSTMMEETNMSSVPTATLAVCEKLRDLLPGKGSRFELVRRWGIDAALGHGIDVGFSKTKRVQIAIDHCKASNGFVVDKVRVANYTSMRGMVRFKYLVVVSGQDKATNLNWALWTDSVPLMPPPVDESWLCEGWLEPWVHYVPLRPDFSDLKVKIDWLRRNQAVAANIARAGRLFLESHFGKFDPSEASEEAWMARERELGFWVVRLYAAHILQMRTRAQSTP